ncbi:MAG: tandem-95 repeat protein [Cyclobacteriaceae bacterium]|nr:tandem-95 repeat protein [Cyclobacteriaceae bacterium]
MNKRILFTGFTLCLLALAPCRVSYAIVPPSTNNNTVITKEDVPHHFAIADFPFADDLENNNFAFVRMVSNPAEGKLLLGGVAIPNGTAISVTDIQDGLLVFWPDENEFMVGYTTFDFTVIDDGMIGNESSSATITIDVTAENDPPTINEIIDQSSTEDMPPLTVNLSGISAGPANESGQTLTITAMSSDAAIVPDGVVTYTQGDATGTVTFTPVANANGSVTFTLTIGDGELNVPQTFELEVVPVNDHPTINEIIDQSTAEDTPLTVNLSGISAGPANESGQTLTITAISSDAAIVPDGVVTYTQGDVTGTVTFTPVANATGSVNINLVVMDNGGVLNGGDNVKSIGFIIDVTGANDPPTMNDIANPPAINEDSPEQSIALSGISDGDPESVQTLSLSATSNNTELIDNVSIEYAANATTALIKYTPKPNASGSATITVTLSDGTLSVQKTFIVVVSPVNDPPTLDAVPDPAIILEDAGEQTVTITGISAGPNETPPPTVAVSSSNLSLIPAPSISYNSIDGTALVKYTPITNQYGLSIITVSVNDGNSIKSEDWIVTVASMNDEPTIDHITDLSTNEDTPITINITGISSGSANESTQSLTITAVSNNQALMPNGVVGYTQGSTSGTVTFSPLANATGVAAITLTVKDNGGTVNPGEDDTKSLIFNITVTGTDDPPTMADIANPSPINEDAPEQSIALSGISDGDPDLAQPLTFTAVSSNTSLIDNITIDHVANAASAVLKYKPKANAFGTTTITVTLSDGALSIQKSFAVVVNSVNDLPTSANKNISILEDNTKQFTATDFVFNDPDNGSFTKIIVTSLPANGSLKLGPNPVSLNQEVTFASIGQLAFEPTANENGNGYANFDFKVHDGSDFSAVAYTIGISVSPVNDEPTIDQVSDMTTPEDVPLVVNLTSISPGPNESGQTLTITAISGNTFIVGNGIVNYTQGSSTATVTFTPKLDATGIATITVTVKDSGGTVNPGDDDTKTFTFSIDVGGTNDPPTLNDIPNPAAINEDAGQQTINLGGITDGDPDEVQEIKITAQSDNINLIDKFTITYEQGNTTAILRYTPKPEASGKAMVSVTVSDGSLSRIKTFEVLVNPVNDPPTLNPIANPPAILEDAAQQQIILTGLTAGPNENQGLSIIVTSSNEALISDLKASYTAASQTGVLKYTSNANQFGTAEITVTVDDGALINNTISRKFTMEVKAVADQPRVSDAFTNQGLQTNNGLVIERHVSDGSEVTHFKITNISQGKLYQSNGTTEISNNTFISFAMGNAGLKFTPNSSQDGSFNVQASLSNTNAGLGGELATARIIINSFPTSSGLPEPTLNEDSENLILDLYQIFDDKEDPDKDLKFEVRNSNPNLVETRITGNQLVITLKKDANGDAIITVKCTDTKGAFIEDAMTLTVVPVNDPPVFTSAPVLTGSQGQEYVYQIVTMDVEGDDRYFDWIAPGWLFVADNGDGTATLSGTPEEKDVGSFNIDVVVLESEDNTKATQSFILNIANVNDPPVFTSIPETDLLETEKYTYNVEISDSDLNDTFTVQISPNKPPWLVFSSQAPYKLEGFAPVGSAGTYPITLIAIDKGGLTAEQRYSITVTAPNNLPQLSNLNDITIEEDQNYTFNASIFKDAFTDGDPNDSLVAIKFIEVPANGKLMLEEREINENDSIGLLDIELLKLVPQQDFNGINFFTWNGSDGRDFAAVASRGLITVLPVDDAPEVINLETNAIIFNFGDYNAPITQAAEVLEVDEGRISWAKITISNNYLDSQDSLSIDKYDGINTSWNDTTGTLTISGIKKASIYQDILRSMIYTNHKRILPNTKTRIVEIIVSDGELSSTPVSREIQFEDTFVELVIPSGFTPNQDMVNDTWEIENLIEQSDAVVRVYARDGNMVYESVGQYKEWDGTYKGAVLSAGVYYYTIEILKFERKYSGSITILR